MPDNSESYECGECGKVFDSKRGLHIHQSKVHGSVSDEEPSSLFQIKSAKPWILAAVIIMLGLIFLSYSPGLVGEDTGNMTVENTVHKDFQTKTITVRVVRNSTETEKESPGH